MKIRARLVSQWEHITTSYWFIPSLMSLAGVVMSVVLVRIDMALQGGEWLTKLPFMYTGTPSGAQTLLAAIASSMIGLAGVVFSISIVALTLASGQFGPRLLRNFMRDKGNQVTLGTFLAAFVYCLLVLRNVYEGQDDGPGFVPQLSILAAVLTALAGLGVLIFFIHHTASSIQAPVVIAEVANDLSCSINSLFPEKLGIPAQDHAQSSDPKRHQVPAHFEYEAVNVRAGRSGYVQRIEADQLLQEATQRNLVVRVEHRPGQFVQAQEVVLRVWPPVGKPVLDSLRQVFVIGVQRSLSQDAEFAVEQLVEVASRALSPGINDPFTAMQCIDRLGDALSVLAARRMPAGYRLDSEGWVRIMTEPYTFERFLDASYNQIRQYAANSPDVLARMIEAMARIAPYALRREDRACLTEHAEAVYRLAAAAVVTDRDGRQIERLYKSFQQALARSDPRKLENAFPRFEPG